MPKIDPQYRLEPVYMEKNALAFLRAWPNVPEVHKPVAGRMLNAGLLKFDPDTRTNKLTQIGEYVKTLVDSQSYNCFNTDDMLKMWSPHLFAVRDKRALDFLRLFDIEIGHKGSPPKPFDDQFLRKYMELRLASLDEGTPILALGNLPALIQINKMAQERLWTAMKAWRSQTQS